MVEMVSLRVKKNRRWTTIEVRRNAESLDFINEELEKIDLTPLSGLPRLKKLLLSFQQLECIDLSPLAGCTRIQTLDLTSNRLANVDLTPLSGCTRLQTIGLAHNRLERVDLSPLAGCISLQRIDLSSNLLLGTVDISPLFGLRELYYLLVDDEMRLIANQSLRGSRPAGDAIRRLLDNNRIEFV